MGNSTQGVEQYTITTIFPIKKKANTRTFPQTEGKLASIAFKSLDNLLRIRPRGTLSKNSLRLENNRLEIIS